MSKIAYSPQEAADQVCVSARTISRAIADGELTAHYRNGLTRIMHADLEAWIASAPTEKRVAS